MAEGKWLILNVVARVASVPIVSRLPGKRSTKGVAWDIPVRDWFEPSQVSPRLPAPSRLSALRPMKDTSLIKDMAFFKTANAFDRAIPPRHDLNTCREHPVFSQRTKNRRPDLCRDVKTASIPVLGKFGKGRPNPLCPYPLSLAGGAPPTSLL